MEFIIDILKQQGISRGDYYILGCSSKNSTYVKPFYYKFISFKSLRRTLREFIDMCNQLQMNCYFSCSIYTGRTHGKDFISPKTRFINCDGDKGDYTKTKYKPYAVWESSPGSVQVMYKVPKHKTTESLDRSCKGLRKAMKEEGFAFDCCDISRFLRIPGSYNFKPKRVQANGGIAPQVDNLRILGNKIEKCPRIKKTNLRYSKCTNRGLTLDDLDKEYRFRDDELLGICRFINNRIEDYENGSDRSSLAYYTLSYLIKYGIKTEDIFELFTNEKGLFPYINDKWDTEDKLNNWLEGAINNLSNSGVQSGQWRVEDGRINLNFSGGEIDSGGISN